jgi:hypothetical protein
MLRRFVALALWAYFGWYLAAHLATLIGVPAELSVTGALVMALVATIDVSRFRRSRPEIAKSSAS